MKKLVHIVKSYIIYQHANKQRRTGVTCKDIEYIDAI